MFLDTGKLNAQIREAGLESARRKRAAARAADLSSFGVASASAVELSRYLSLQPQQLAEKLTKLAFSAPGLSAALFAALAVDATILSRVEPALRARIVAADAGGVLRALAIVVVLVVGEYNYRSVKW